MKFLSFLLLCGSLLAVSCAAKKVNPLQYEKTKLSFGSGGGFAGTVITYSLLENGQLFEMTKMGQEYVSLDRIDKNQVTQLMESFKLFNFDELELNQPDNMYYFMEYSSDGNTNRLVWSEKEENTNLKLLHKILMNLVPK